MAKTILIAVIIVLLNVLVGCRGVDSGESQLVPVSKKVAVSKVKAPESTESDIIEQIAIDRQAYLKGLESLIAHYNNTGDNMKLLWAKDELRALGNMPKYNYIIEASVAGPELKAIADIPEANDIYDKAFKAEKEAGRLLVIKDENLLRVALNKYNQLIRQHPSSDKIDDAAYQAAGIYEYFKDYTIAVLYYQRAYQWNAETINPARFKAAYIMDKHMARRAEALELYQQAVEKDYLTPNYREFAEKRIGELTKSGETLKESE